MSIKRYRVALMIVSLFTFLGLVLSGFSTIPASQISIQMPSPTPTPRPYKCYIEPPNYQTFEADYLGVTQVCPAHNQNKDGRQIKSKKLYIVIHSTGNTRATSIQVNIDIFQNPIYGVSAHYIVGLNDRDAVQVIQMVKETDRANQAGNVTKVDGQLIDNSNSIGIEVVGIGTLDGWPADSVYQAVGDLVTDIARRHKEQGQEIELTRNFIVGHEEISTIGKPDPGPNWDWQRFMEQDLAGTYIPAVKIHAERNKDTNTVTLSLDARKSLRTGYQLEVSEDDGTFRALSELAKDGKIANTPAYGKDSPQTFVLTPFIPPVQEHPVKACYQAKTIRGTYTYINPSSLDCVIIGSAGFNYDSPDRNADVVSQDAFPIVKPGEEVDLRFKMRNTGILSWKPGGQYVFINTGGETFGLETQVVVPQQIWTNEAVEFHLRFRAPQKPSAYTTRWQMAYINAEKNIELFGKETGGIVTVLPEGNTRNLKEIIQTIIDNAVQAANQKVEDYLADLQRRIQAEIENAFRNWLVGICPPLAPLFGIVISSILVNRRNRSR
jgi:N-acetyl-anhydromuramyl-L-alanine amidase AmpD